MNEYLKFAADTAREAGEILRQEFHRPKKISYKGEVDIVTETDKRSEAIVVARIRERFPDHAIIAEEGGGAGAAVTGAKYCWHVDPLDGTTNFAHGYPCFAVSIGLSEDGEPIAGVVFNPVSNEFFSAARGEGAYLNEQQIRVSSVDKLATSLVATGFPTHQRKRSANMNYYWEFTLRSHGVRRDGSAALDLCSVACGRFDAYWEFRLNSWDTAAGVLLVREAGGAVTAIDGGPYHLGGPSLVASNGLIHEEMKQVSDIAERAAQTQ
ncbi:MAG TPA: inositol monophosphatase family protein [Candidatus Baltobacteraceae bacterium]|nr:inositol monophosphatase family protein [Candidatus Baltobacteraceae bacterium]